jgi:Holliday junction resolvase
LASDAALRRYASPCGAVSQWRHVDVLFSTMSDEGRASYCFECKQALTEKVRLSEEDLRALHQLRRGN